MKTIGLKSAKDIFEKRFYGLRVAVVQKLDANAKNIGLRKVNITGDWPPLRPETDVVALSFMLNREREFWVGRLIEQSPSPRYLDESLFEFVVDKFEFIGTHYLDEVSDAAFYGTGGGGGSRVYVDNQGLVLSNKDGSDVSIANAPGENVKREIWMRRNHHKFRDVVRRNWSMKCAVTGLSNNGLLVASHIWPWSRSTARQKTDVSNGLLLSSPWDALFDRGLVGFDEHGKLLVSKRVDADTRRGFGVGQFD